MNYVLFIFVFLLVNMVLDTSRHLPVELKHPFRIDKMFTIYEFVLFPFLI